MLRLAGSPYEMGYRSGRALRGAVQAHLNEASRLSGQQDVWRQCRYVLDKLNEQSPDYVEEVHGKADDAFTIDNWMLSRLAYPDGSWQWTNDNWDLPFGNGFGWNSAGIVKTINYCSEPNPVLKNIPGVFLQRHMSDATSFNDLLVLASAFSPASGFHFNVIDRESNRAYSIEVYVDGMDVLKIEEHYIHSNHFLYSSYENAPMLDPGSNGIFRLYKAEQLFSRLSPEGRSVDALRSVLEYRDGLDRFDYSIHQTDDDPYRTGAFFASSTGSDVMDLSVYTHGERLEIPYGA